VSAESDPGPQPRGGALRRAEPALPAWVSGSAVRFAVLCGCIAVIAMLSPHVTPHQAGILALAGGLATVAAGGALAWATHILADREEARGGGGRGAVALLGLLRATGLPLLGLAFFLVWSFVYLGMYWYAPHEAFTGLAPLPRYADFFYYSVSTGLISPPGDIIAQSRGARAATVIEMLTGLALVTTYLSGLAVGRLGVIRAAARAGERVEEERQAP
jgi:hypothetical protein